MIEREEYLNKLIAFKDKDLIKVVTGIRRCGKSTLFDLYINYLKESGIQDNQIIKLNLEDSDFDFITNYKELYTYIKERLQSEQQNYVFIDEIQKIKCFETACDSLYIKKNVDLYINGSNAELLSGEIATLLSGRYIEIKMLPLSFKEYIGYKGSNDLIIKYNDYITKSSFPYTLKLSTDEEIKMYLDGIYNTIVIKDIITRRKITSVNVLEDIMKFMFDNIGSLVSATKISNTLCSKGRKISVQTVENYLTYLCESFILYKAERYDIKGKERLSTGVKYYLSDIGLRYYLLGSKKADQGHILENIVYLELLRRGYKIFIGKNNENEIDFVTYNDKGVNYYQVSYSVI